MARACSVLMSLICCSAAASFAAGGKSILSATYGLAGCIGINTRDHKALAKHNCTVVNGATNALPERRVIGLWLAGACKKIVRNADGMPITFSAPVDPKTVHGDAFNVTLNTGEVVSSICAMPNPANEKNEMQTFATLGYFGDGFADTKYPVKVDVVGDVVFTDGTSARGLQFNISASQRYVLDSPFLVQAHVLPFDTAGESDARIPTGVYPNHCQHLYGSIVTHRVRIVMNGGTTLDGINSMLPNQTDVFELLDAAGNHIVQPVVGLADLGNKATGSFGSYKQDGDNFFDICLDATKGPIDKITRVRMPCTHVKAYLPSGRTPCKDNNISVTFPDAGNAHIIV